MIEQWIGGVVNLLNLRAFLQESARKVGTVITSVGKVHLRILHRGEERQRNDVDVGVFEPQVLGRRFRQCEGTVIHTLAVVSKTLLSTGFVARVLTCIATIDYIVSAFDSGELSCVVRAVSTEKIGRYSPQ